MAKRQPNVDGSHDILDNEPSDKTAQWMQEIISPLFDECSEAEKKEFLLDMANLFEKEIRAKWPDSELLTLLDEQRKKERGFE